MSTYKDKTAEKWAEEMQELLGQIEDRAPFSYDPASDALYQQYRDQYTNLGKLAMEDTEGQAAALTGGYGSTYGETAGFAAYSAYLDKLNNILPELYDRGQAAYDRQTDAMYDRLDYMSAQQAAAQKAADEAFDRCMELLENGIRPSDEDLASAGITAQMADTALAIFRYNTGFYGTGSGGYGGNSGNGSSGSGNSGSGSGNSGSGGGSSSGSSSSGSGFGSAGYDNCGLTDAQVKELQTWLGVSADGEYGPKTQSAADKQFGGSGLTAIQAWIAYQKAIGAYGGGSSGGTGGGNTDTPH